MKIPFLFFLFLVSTLLYSEQAPSDKSTMIPATDTVHYGDSHHSDDIIASNETKNESSSDSNSEADGIIPSWKLYTIMLAFPIILILIFIFVYIRGKR